MMVGRADAAAEKLKAARVRLTSAGVTTIPDRALGINKGFLVRDPDGHALQLIEKHQASAGRDMRNACKQSGTPM